MDSATTSTCTTVLVYKDAQEIQVSSGGRKVLTTGTRSPTDQIVQVNGGVALPTSGMVNISCNRTEIAIGGPTPVTICTSFQTDPYTQVSSSVIQTVQYGTTGLPLAPQQNQVTLQVHPIPQFVFHNLPLLVPVPESVATQSRQHTEMVTHGRAWTTTSEHRDNTYV